MGRVPAEAGALVVISGDGDALEASLSSCVSSITNFFLRRLGTGPEL